MVNIYTAAMLVDSSCQLLSPSLKQRRKQVGEIAEYSSRNETLETMSFQVERVGLFSLERKTFGKRHDNSHKHASMFYLLANPSGQMSLGGHAATGPPHHLSISGEWGLVIIQAGSHCEALQAPLMDTERATHKQQGRADKPHSVRLCSEA